jgi:dTDP-4-amino-4,6-dideoxygalactose transaminase
MSLANNPDRSSDQDPIYVTKAFLPPQQDYAYWMSRIWDEHCLTNNGPIHRELEELLRQRFEVPHMRLVANGTLALQIALRTLKISGEVITTPYSYVATTSAILWEHCKPVFVDVLPENFSLDPRRIEAAITPHTTAILATHVYGIPGEVEEIQRVADRHGLKVIYDAAHAFDVKFQGRSILEWGHASTLSFHATKLFHTVEGGAVVVHSENLDMEVKLLRSFGHIADDHFIPGMNAKMSEMHAAMGMAVLPYMSWIKERRMKLCQAYDELLDPLPIERPVLASGVEPNYSYYPVIFKDRSTRDRVFQGAAERGIHCRKYFEPSLNDLPYVEPVPMPVSEDISGRVLCLPLYPQMDTSVIERVIDAVRAHCHVPVVAI